MKFESDSVKPFEILPKMGKYYNFMKSYNISQ